MAIFWESTRRQGVHMNSDQTVGTRDLPQYLAGGGCLLSIPIILGFGFRTALKYAENKEHQFAHQVEDVELEGDAAALVEDNMSTKESLQRFVKKLDRITAQFAKMGGRFSQEDYQREKGRLESLQARLSSEKSSDPECQALVSKAQQCLQQYAPQV